MAIVLSLFSESEMRGVSVPKVMCPGHQSSALTEVCSPQPLRAKDWCNGCPFYGLCDSDECAALGFPIDSPAPSTRFPNLGAYIDYLKKHGWG